MRTIPIAIALAAAAACGSDSQLDEVVPGERIGPVALGMAWRDVVRELGVPPSDPVVLVRLGIARWPTQGIEVLLTSPDDAVLTDDAIVIGVATDTAVSKAAIEDVHGIAAESYTGHAYYATGFAVQYGDDDTAERVAVFAREEAARDGIDAVRFPAGVDIGGTLAGAVDMHLHPGDYTTLAPTGKAFVAANLPPALQIFAPDLLDRLSDPWSKHVGIAEQTALAGIGHAVLFAVYAPHSTGVFSNDALVALLDDPRNITGDGRPWAWGMASIDFEGWNDAVGPGRLAELRALLAARPLQLIGIKLAHAHQQVRLDDAAYEGVYAIADELDVPVLLHTGLSPFPGTATEPRYYDPSHLASVIARFPTLDIVLSHVGQGDERSIKHALDLAAAHEHVWLELSALGRPPLVDEHGDAASSTAPQYPAVLAAIRERGLVDRALFASDGPQYSGAVRGYVTKLVAGMREAGYTPDELQAVLAGNFVRLFRRVPPPAR